MFEPATALMPPSASQDLAKAPTLLILGEAPGDEELAANSPFVGSAGRLLRNELLPSAGLDPSQWNFANVFLQRPPSNDIKNWTLTKTDYKRLFGTLPPNTPPPIAKRYLHPDHYWQLEELKARLEALRPSFIICLGATAAWAITGDARIASQRGTIFKTPWGSGIATYNPAAVLKEYSFRPFSWADLSKARLWLEDSLPEPTERKLWYDPTLQEIAFVYHKFRRDPSLVLGVDIETCPANDQITTISFGTPFESICIPIWDRYAEADSCNYWPTAKDELLAWRWIERYCNLPNPKVLQNGMYDMQYMLDAPIQLRLKGKIDDTAIMAHAQQPELRKDLGTLASLYLNEPSWKLMRQAAKDAKVDE